VTAPTSFAAPAPVAAAAPAPVSVGKRTLMMGGGPASAAPASGPLSIEAAPGSIPSQVIFKREQDATDAVPLTYREYVYLVPPGTSETDAEILLVAQLDLVRRSLERVAPGKLVNLGVFDVAFQGKPSTPPIATLAWKDWRGVPDLAFPRRPGATPAKAPAVVASPIVAIAAAPAPAAVPASVPAPAPAAIPAPAPIAAAAPVAVAVPAPVPVAPLVAPPLAAPVSVPPAAAPATLTPSAPPAPLIQSAPPAPLIQSTPVAPPAPAPAAVAPAPAAPVAAPAAIRTATPGTGVALPRRIRGEDLIAELFEAMHDLHFVRDSVEGGDFCLALAMEKLPSQAGMVHLYDINSREFLVSSVRGPSTGKLLAHRHPETDELLSAAMRKRRTVVLDKATSEAQTIERYAAIGGVRSLMVAPVMQSGRFLGAIELVNPLDGQPFTEAEGNALAYIAEQFAEFVATRGIVIDPERLSARNLPGS
jgi:hypothetical protein